MPARLRSGSPPAPTANLNLILLSANPRKLKRGSHLNDKNSVANPPPGSAQVFRRSLGRTHSHSHTHAPGAIRRCDRPFRIRSGSVRAGGRPLCRVNAKIHKGPPPLPPPCLPPWSGVREAADFYFCTARCVFSPKGATAALLLRRKNPA